MAKRKKRRKHKDYYEEEDQSRGFEMNPETKRGIIIVTVFALAALMFLSFFGIAGSLGNWIETGLSTLLGWDRFLLPIVLLVIGATRIFPDRGQLSVWNYLGFILFFLSFNGLLNLLLLHVDDPVTNDLKMAGGWLGEVLAMSLPPVIGFWGAFVVIASFLLVGILLVFNTSLRNLLAAHQHFTGWLGVLLHLGRRKKNEEEEEWEDTEEEEEEEEEEETEPEEVEEEPIKKVVKVPSAEIPEEEEVLTTRRQRKVTIPLDLLDYRSSKGKAGDLEKNKEIIHETFHQFGIEVEMGSTQVGPTVSQYTLRPAQGIKLSRILGLQNDLALALAAHPIRIEAPIPGKSLVGIEIPNQSAAIVSLREMLESKEFKKRKNNLCAPLGQDVSGSPLIMQIDKMPHVLVAGATGSGKSVCLNTIIATLLYSNGPDALKLILVDPKRVEMKMYEGIPHLLVPPITKTEDTVNALKWTVREMDRRLDVLAKFGAKDINSYNERCEEKMPKIVVIIDELADLMTSSGREVEATITRISQMARAVGIHLILATQRPSVDVITGVIKANIPARLAFAVASQTDSRTILDCAGAEKLLGRGDMLFSCAELSKPKRIQGAFLSEKEIERVVDFLKHEGDLPDYNYAITETERTGTILDGPDDDGDPLLEDAIQVILQSGKASTSFLQRRMKIGYARAARIIDLLEDRGIVGPGDGAKPREVLIDEWPPAGNRTNDIPTAQVELDEAAEDWEDEDESEDETDDDNEEETGGEEEEEQEEEIEEEEDEEDEEER
ncbi:DNA translocase FtsK [Patescibacteria group bacterium]|nr:DNA translocase FtsK [Patescibacteria group bacterium]MBU1705225.1 DNA translocase FtsK [Patescibacteria group bacterium]